MADPKKKDAPASPAETAPENKPAEGENAELIALRERAERAEQELAKAREESKAMEARFDAAWAEREAQIRALDTHGVLPETAPVRGRMVRFARHTIHCSDAKGQPLTIQHGHSIPEGAQLEGVGADAIGEREEG